ncbi:MAG: starch-binding protein [Bacilli bacterium]|nr:starch-binding protein [Bacilli bacterium]
MKKQLWGLGAVALALGAVAGAVGARAAVESKAEVHEYITVYFKDASWWATDGARTSTYLWKGETNNTWPGTVMTGVESGVWKATVDVTDYDHLIFARYNATDVGNKDWGAKSVAIDLTAFDAAKPLYDISGSVAVWGDPGVEGTWKAYEEPSTSSSSEASSAATSEESSVPAVNLPGTVYITNNKGWENVNVYAWKGETKNAEWPGAAATFDHKNGDSQDVYKVTGLGEYDHLIINNGTTQTRDVAGNEFGENNAVWIKDELVDGHNDVGFWNYAPSSSSETSSAASSSSAVSASYTVKIGLGDPVALAENTSASLASNQLGEYYVDGLNLKKNDLVVFANGGAAIDTKIGGDTGSNSTQTTEAEKAVINVHNDVDNASIYLKAWEDGGYSYFITGYVAGATGYYILTASGEWNVDNGILSNGASGLNVATFINVNFAADEEFVVGKFIDGVRDVDGGYQYDAGWSDVKGGGAVTAGAFVDAAKDNHIKCATAGKYCVYLNGEKGIYLEPYAVSPDDYTAVDTFVATYITPKAGAASSGDTCEAKYNAAKTALLALTEIQQDLFRNDSKYAEAYAIYLEWEAAAQSAGTYKVTGLSAGNTALIIGLSVLAVGAAAAGAMIYFSRKKKAE